MQEHFPLHSHLNNYYCCYSNILAYWLPNTQLYKIYNVKEKEKEKENKKIRKEILVTINYKRKEKKKQTKKRNKKKKQKKKQKKRNKKRKGKNNKYDCIHFLEQLQLLLYFCKKIKNKKF